jgi:hypothetical protein
MPITAPPTIPLITDPSTFSVRAQDWVVWQADELYPFITESSAALALSTTSSSSTSNTIGTGAKTFTVETGKGYVAGQSLSIAYTTTPTNRMFAVVTSYNSTTGELVVEVQAIEGSGTYTAWSIALAFNGVIANAQVPNNELTLNKLARVGTAGQVLTSGGSGADASYTTLNRISQLDSSDTITDSGSNGMRELTLDGVVRERQTASARLSTIDGGSTLYPEFKCRAWVNFNGTGTVAINASGNVSSITDNGVGDYTVNLTTAMPDANYSVSATSRNSTNPATNTGSLSLVSILNTKTTSAVRIANANINANATAANIVVAADSSEINITIYR